MEKDFFYGKRVRHNGMLSMGPVLLNTPQKYISFYEKYPSQKETFIHHLRKEPFCTCRR